MKELDFLPEWYKDGKRCQVHVRRQCAALVIVFLAMMTFNLTATLRASKAAAALARLDPQRVRAEAVVYEFNSVTKELNALKVRAGLIEQMDSKIDVAAILAEMSHLIGASVALSKVELVAEPLQRPEAKEGTSGSAPRIIGGAASPKKSGSLGNVGFRIVLAGIAAHPAHVADLVCKLDESSYFRRVYPSFSRNAKIQVGAEAAGSAQAGKATAPGRETLDATEFEITCRLANYEEIEK
jgi:hypothetical protein